MVMHASLFILGDLFPLVPKRVKSSYLQLEVHDSLKVVEHGKLVENEHWQVKRCYLFLRWFVIIFDDFSLFTKFFDF